MSNVIDNRVLGLQFDNSQFEKGVQQSISSMNNLNESLQLKDSAKGISEAQSAVNSFDTSSMASSLSTIQDKFSALSIVGITALQRLTNEAINAASRISNSLTSSLVSGGKTRALNLEQANFQMRGLGLNAKQVKSAMSDALYAVEGTAYGLDSAAKAGSQLMASGVKIGKDLRSSLRGISGVAAMTNSSYDDIANVFTRVAGNGRVMGEDLLSLSSRGLNLAAELGKQMHKSEKEIREMVTDGKISFKEFSAAMDAAYGEHAKDANKTFEGSLSNLKAALSRIGANFFTPFYENMRKSINAITPFVDAIKNALTPAFDSMERVMVNARKTVVSFFNTLTKQNKKDKYIGDAETFQNVIKNLIKALQNLNSIVGIVGRVVGKAFSSIFPKLNTKDILNSLLNFSKRLKQLTKDADPSGDTIRNLRYIFQGFFSVLKLGWMVIKEVAKAFKGLFDIVKPVGSGLLTIFGELGKNITMFVQGIEKTGGIDIKPLTDFFSALSKGLPNVDELSANAANGINNFFNGISTMGPTVSDILNSIGEGLKGIATAINENLGSNKVLEGGVFAVIIYWARRLILTARNFVQTVSSFTGLNGITTTLNQVRDTLLAMENQLNWKGLMNIAIAVGVLAASLAVLAMIPEDKLANGLGAITIILAALTGAMMAMQKVMLGGNIKEIFSKNIGGGFDAVLKAFGSTMIIAELSNALLKLAISVGILALAVKTLSSLDLEQLRNGLIGVGFILAELAAFTKLMDGTKLQNSVMGVIPLATALLILSASVAILGSMDTGKVVQGIVAIGVLLAEIGVFAKLLRSINLSAAAVGILGFSAGLLVMSAAIAVLSVLDPQRMVYALFTIGVLLAEIGGFAKLVSSAKLDAAAPGILAMAAALAVMTASVAVLSVLDLGGVAQALVAIGVVLTELVVACGLMENALPGAAAMVVASAALLVLSAAITVLSMANPLGVVVGLVAIAAALAIFGVAATVLTPTIPAMIGLASALLIFGAAIAAVGIGIAAFAIGMATLAGITAAGVAAIGSFITNFCTMIVTKIPEIGAAAVAIGTAILDGLTKLIPDMITFGATFILKMLEGIGKNVGKVVDKALKVATLFIKGLKDGLEKHKDELSTAIAELITTVIGGAIETIEKLFSGDLPDILSGAVKTIGGFVDDLSEAISGLIDSFSGFLDSVANVVTSVGDAISTVVISSATALSIALDSIVSSLERLAAIDAISLAKALGTLGLAFGELILAGGGLVAVAGTYEKVGKGLADMGWGMEQVVRYSGSINGALYRLKVSLKQLDGVKDLLSTIGDSFKTFAESMSSNNDTITAVANTFDRLKDTINNLSSGMSSLSNDSNTTANAFSSITSSADGIAGFKDSLNDFMIAAEDAANRSGGLGNKIAESYNTGITSKAGAARDAGKQLASNAESGVKSGGNWRSLGEDAAQGYVNGITSKISDAKTAAKKLVEAGTKKTAKTQESKSPSKVYKRLGSYASEGYALGILSNLKMVANSTEDMTESGLNSMAISLSKASDLWSDEVDASPVITPVIDLDSLSNQAAVASSMFDSMGTSIDISGQVRGINSTLTAQLQNRTSNLEIVSALNDLKSELLNRPQVINNNSVNGITYDDGSNIANAIGAIVNGVEMQTRAGVR